VPGTGRPPLCFSAPPPAQEIAFEQIHKHPPMRILQQAVLRHGRSASFEVLIDYDAEGRVTVAPLMRSSGDQAFDRTVLVWISAVRLRPGAAGTGRLPTSFHTE
jgi:TonB family protein